MPRRVLLIAGGLTVLVAASVVLTVLRPWAADPEDTIPVGVRDELAASVVAILESDPAGRTVLTSGPERMACAARPFGTEPPAVTEAAAARRVFAWVSCTTVGGSPDSSTSLPVAVDLEPVRVERPGDGAAYASGIRRIFPKRLHDAAFDEDRRYAATLRLDLQRRVEQIS